MISKRGHDVPSSLHLAEQAIHLLRQAGSALLAQYYAGALPFILGLLYFWSDMSRDPLAHRRCAPAAMGLALLFIWMKVWQVRFSRRLMNRLHNTPDTAWSVKRFLTTACRQAALQATSVAVLPLSLGIFFPWAYSFYQNATVLDESPEDGVLQLARRAFGQTVLWPAHNLLLVLILLLFGGFIFMNIGVAILVLPGLFKSMLGIDTVFTLSGHGLLNTTFLASVCALTYLCIDPIVKASYALRCFHGLSRHNGNDLRALLKPLITVSVLATVCIGGQLLSPLARAGAAEQPPFPDPWQAVADGDHFAEQWDQAIEKVLEQRRFSWRLPRDSAPEPEQEQEQGWLAAALDWSLDAIKAGVRKVRKWINDFFDWLTDKLISGDTGPIGEGADWRGLLKAVFYVIGCGFVLLLCYMIYRRFFVRKPLRKRKDESRAVYSVDLTDESVSAADLPTDRWVAMARALIEKKAFREALRAVYLSIISLLADNSRLAIARYKSNLDYYRELERRAHAEPELLQLFHQCMQVFEKTWYGAHPVAGPQLEEAFNAHKRIAALVRQDT